MKWRVRFPAAIMCITAVGLVTFAGLAFVAVNSSHVAADATDDLTNSNFHYAIIIDAGSSGSRLYIYRCDYDLKSTKEILKVTPVLDEREKPVVKKKSPGLSSFANNPESAVSYVKEMIDASVHHVPSEYHGQTFLFILATAGMRLLSDAQQSAIMLALRQNLPSAYRFIISESNVQVISGKWEGLYAWISVNYILGRFDYNSLVTKGVTDSDVKSAEAVKDRKRTAGILDLGGASLQLAYELRGGPSLRSINGSYIEELNLGFDDSVPTYKYNVFVNTYLGYGANTAIDRYEQWLAKSAMAFESNKNQSLIEIGDCCLPVGLKKKSKVHLDRSVEIVRNGQGCYDSCYNTMRQLIVPNISCASGKCALEGVPLPEIMFSATEFYGMSEYWYCTNDVLNQGGVYSYNTVRESSQKFCHLNWTSIWTQFKRKLYPSADRDRIRTQCLKTAWAFALLHEGLKFPTNITKFYSVSKVGGHDIQWTLGAVLYRLRHLPLQLVNKFQRTPVIVHGGDAWSHSSPFGWRNWFMQIIIFLSCVAFLLFVVDFCMLHFCRQSRGFRIMSALRRNQSFISYMMVDNGESILPRHWKSSNRPRERLLVDD